MACHSAPGVNLEWHRQDGLDQGQPSLVCSPDWSTAQLGIVPAAICHMAIPVPVPCPQDVPDLCSKILNQISHGLVQLYHGSPYLGAAPTLRFSRSSGPDANTGVFLRWSWSLQLPSCIARDGLPRMLIGVRVPIPRVSDAQAKWMCGVTGIHSDSCS